MDWVIGMVWIFLLIFLKILVEHSRYPLQEAENRILEHKNITYSDNDKNKDFSTNYILGKISDDVDFSKRNPGFTNFSIILSVVYYD